MPEGRNRGLISRSYTASLVQVPCIPISEGSEASGHLFASMPFSFVAPLLFLPHGIAIGKCDHFFSQPVSWDQDFVAVKLHGWSNEDKLVSKTSPVSSKSNHVKCLEIKLKGHSRPTLPSPVTAISQGGG